MDFAPVQPDFRFYLAMALSRLGELEAAAEELTRVLELVPEDRVARLRRALVWNALGRQREAIEEIEQLAASAPHDPAPRQALARLRANRER